MARGKTLRRVAARGAAALIAISCVSISFGNAADKAAHDLAQRFAGGSDAGAKPAKPKASGLTEADRKAHAPAKTKVSQKKIVEPDATKAEEDDMLKRARLEAEERREAARIAAEQEEAEDRRREAEALAAEQRKAEEVAEQRKAEEAAEQRKAEERRVAEEHRIAEERRLAGEKRQAEAQHYADEMRAAEEKRLADEKRVADEQRMAEEKRAADEQRIAEEKRRAEEQRIAEEKRTAEAARLAAEADAKAMQEEAEKRLAEQRLRVLERDREEEARRLTAKLNKVNEERMKREAEAASKPDSAPPSPPQTPQTYGVASEPKSVAEPKPAPAETVSASARSLGRVTILLVIEPGTNGIRRFGKKTADPVICAGQSCWTSAGPEHKATAMERGKALGPGNTLGRRAGACNQSLTCVFRDVDLGSTPQALQPIDLRVMRHDRREPLTVTASGRCEVAGGQLYCSDMFKSRTWRAWIVPESVAEHAGPEALKAAVEGGLSSARAADLRTTLRQ